VITMATDPESDADRTRHWRDLLASERDAEALYTRLAEAETGERRTIFEELAGIEHKHAAHWAAKISEAGAEVPPPGRPSFAPSRPPRCRPRTGAPLGSCGKR